MLGVDFCKEKHVRCARECEIGVLAIYRVWWGFATGSLLLSGSSLDLKILGKQVQVGSLPETE